LDILPNFIVLCTQSGRTFDTQIFKDQFDATWVGVV